MIVTVVCLAWFVLSIPVGLLVGGAIRLAEEQEGLR